MPRAPSTPIRPICSMSPPAATVRAALHISARVKSDMTVRPAWGLRMDLAPTEFEPICVLRENGGKCAAVFVSAFRGGLHDRFNALAANYMEKHQRGTG